MFDVMHVKRRALRSSSTPRTRSAASPVFQPELNVIEPVPKPKYYLEYIIAIIGDRRMFETEGCASVIAQRKNQHPRPYRPRADDPGRFRPDYRFKFVRRFSCLRHGSRLPRFLCRGTGRTGRYAVVSLRGKRD